MPNAALASGWREVGHPQGNETGKQETLLPNESDFINSTLDRSVSRLRAKKEARRNLSDDDDQKLSSTIANEDASSELDDVQLVLVPHLFKPKIIEGKSVNTLQEWIGYIDFVDGKNIYAIISDLTDRSVNKERATIPLSVVQKQDRCKAVSGALFHFIIGYSKKNGKTHQRDVIIYFRRHAPNRSLAGVQIADTLSKMREARK